MMTPTDIVTADVRLIYPSLFEATPKFMGSDDMRYQATFLIPEDADLSPYQSAIDAALAAKFSGKVPKLADHPVRSADEKAADGKGGFELGWHYISAKSFDAKTPPLVVDQRRNEIIDTSMVYGGCWVRAHIRAYAWAFSGKKGVSFDLKAVQLVRGGDPIGGASSRASADVFGDLDFESESDHSDSLL